MIRDRIPYEILVQGALRDVIRQVLERVATDGLPGEHHFYITFYTGMAGVEMSARLKERYPDHVTIVLQNQFWDLVVEADHFAVTLSFSDVPERLVVPFMAIKAFYDPVAAFETSFDIASPLPAEPQEIAVFVPKDQQKKSQENISAPLQMGIKKRATIEPIAPQDEEKIPTEDEKGAQVLSLDAFRKK